MTSTPVLTLNNGVTLPALGLGVFQTPPTETVDAVEHALRAGYRHIDTAAAYGNEREVGEAIRRSGVERSEIVVETKIWLPDYGFEQTLHGFTKSAGKLGLDQIDLLILHQPLPSRFDLTIEAYRALEVLLERGSVRAIGVSNFMTDHLADLLAATSVVPAVNQIEMHPFFQQRAVVAANDDAGILTQAWSPIGGITFYRDGAHSSALADPTLVAIAEAHEASPAQVMLAWHLAQGRSAIPKSVNPLRIEQNLAAVDVTLTAADLASIDALDTEVRGGPEPASLTLERFPHPVPEA